MTDQKTPNTRALIRSFLLWFLTFYLLFWGYQMWVGADRQADTALSKNDIELRVTPAKLVQGTPLSVTIRNNQTVAWDYVDPCADGRRLVVSRVLGNNQNVPLEYSQADCTANITAADRLSIPAGEDISLPLNRLPGLLFSEEGNYAVTLPNEVTEEASAASVTVKEPGFIRQTFRTLITQPLFNLLAFLVDKLPTHSLGWAIVIMTILVRMLLILPNQKAMKSQRKLQKLQPEIESLKKKHGQNQQAMAMATMALYKKHKINPMSSCLPILLQMPFLLGIYFVVRDGLRPHLESWLYAFQNGLDLSVVDNAFFGLDLSRPDIFVLPIIVGLAQFIAMKLAMPNLPKTDNKPAKKSKQPAAPDMAAQMQQIQKTMVWVLPVMIAVFTATFPAGVGLYWLTSTVFGIGQQKLVNWQLDRPQVRRKEA